MMTAEEAIRLLQGWIASIKTNIDEFERNGPRRRSAWREGVECLEMASHALREQEERENHTPLTLDELRKMDGEPVWVVCDDLVLCALVEVCEESIFLTNKLGGRTEYACQEELEDDGITAYRSKPKEG